MPSKMMETDEQGRKYMPYVEELVAEVEDKSTKNKKKKNKSKKKKGGETKEASK